MIAVTIRDLSKHFGEHLVLDHVNLRIEPGELFFLLGPSGCGKTTLLRHIAGFYFPDSGQILFDEQDVSRVPPHKRGTGMMFQSYALWPHLTVAGNVAFGLEERRIPEAEISRRVDEALASVGMTATWRTARSTSFPAASSSASPWRGRWSSGRAACCSTNRSPISTPRCACKCAAKSGACARNSA